MAEDIIVPVVMFISIAIVVIFIRKFVNEERKLLLEKDKSADLFRKEGSKYGPLRFGLLFIGGGVGLLIGGILSEITSIHEETAYFSMLFIFGGLGLFISHKMENKRKDEI